MRWVLMLFVILAAVMGGEARAVVVVGRVAVSERCGKAEMVEKRAEALRVESERAFLGAALEVQKAAGLVDAGPLVLWFPGGLAVARSDGLSGTGTTGCRRVSSTTWRYDLADNRVARTVDVQERLTDAAPWVRTLLSRQHCDYTKSTGGVRVADGRNQLGRSVESTYCWKINDGSLWKASEQTVDYAYDANGNRTSRVVHHWTQKRSGQYADGPWELGGWERTLDVMSWDVENRLVAMWRGPWLAQGSSSTVEELVARNPLVGTVWRWGYDHRTRRVWRNEPGPEGQNRVTSVVAFSGGTSVAEFSDGTLSLLLARGVDIGGGTRGLLWTARRETVSAETGSAVTLRFNRYNSRGDVVGQSDAAGVTTWAASYQADGRRTGEIATNLNPKHATGRVRELGVNRDRHRANSKEEDPTGLLNEGFRYRDMETGTFISRDPLGHVDGPNVYCYVRQNPWTMWDPRGLTADEMEVEQHEDETIGVYYRDNPRLGTGRSKTRERVGTLMADGFVDLGNGRKTSMAAIRDEIDSGGTDISKFRSDKSRTLSIDGENDGFGGAILGVDARIFEGVYGPEQFDQDRKLLHVAKQLSEVAVAQYIPGLAVAPALARELQFANAVRVLARTERGAAAAKTATPMTRVGRWMNPAEYEAMKASGTVQGGAGGVSRVAVPATPDAYKAAPKGDIYVEYDVPTSALRPGGTDAWRTIPGPGSPAARQAARTGQPPPEFPKVENISDPLHTK